MAATTSSLTAFCSNIMLDVHYYVLAKIIMIIISTSLAALSIMAPLTRDYLFLHALCNALY